ncbi:MAG: hypothetical protein DMF84_02900 [Acidobacteria bacterium]|nr:MAG: hypothetical protein DMF84_02900 [Acidobacteriota bacterium]
MRALRPAALALLVLYLLAHLALLPRTLEDLDSINFALGVREFDVARHQPHPPGYPVFIALAKLTTSAFRVLGIGAVAPRGLAVWSAIAGAAALPMLFLFFRTLERRDRLAWWSTIVTAAAPLYWFTALRPLSDMTGFACAIASQALMVQRRPRALVAGALMAGLAIGIRSQTAVLTLPLLAFVLVMRDEALPLRTRLAALGASAVGVIAWGVPLLIVSGGLAAYLQALGTQAGEDFGGVVMLWTHRTPRVAAFALVNSFVWPWDWWPGVGMCVLAAAGALRIAWRAPRAILLILVAFAPYAIFHLLFHETETVRYALPMVPVVAYAAMAALETRRPMPMAIAACLIAVVSLGFAIPASRNYAREGAPVFRVFDDMAATAHGGEPVDTIAMHAGARRAAEWAAPILPARVAKAPHGREWLTLVALWRAKPSANVWFVADPARTDLALFDSRARRLARQYRWGFVEPPFVGGARPGPVDWYHMQPPGWMLDRGWSLTAEVGGVTATDHPGPHVAAALAWAKSRADEMLLMIGGRHLGAPGTASTTLLLRVNGNPLASWPVSPGFFMREMTLPAGTLASGSSYVPIELTALVEPKAPVSLEQFDLQGPGVPLFAYDQGWYEPEYNRSLGFAWRWTSERSSLWVRPIGRSVKVTIHGESPMRYYDAPPHVRVLIGNREIAAFDPSSDFDESIDVPADLLAEANGRVTLESSRFFVPGGASGGDQRHLALRIFSVSVD